VNRGVRLLALDLKMYSQVLSLSHGARLYEVRLNLSLSARAAALHAILRAAWRTLSGFFRGGQPALSDFNRAHPNKPMHPTANRAALIVNLSVAAASPRRLIAGVRLLGE